MQNYASTSPSEVICGQVWLRGELMQLAFANPGTLVEEPQKAIDALCSELGLPEKADATQTYAFLVALRQAKAEGLIVPADIKRRVTDLATVLLSGYAVKVPQTPNKFPNRKDKR